jgi:hypothetical protein
MEMNLRHNLIDWLNDYGLEPLADRGIRVSTDERFPGLFNLKYGSICVEKADPIVRACRGAVVEEVLNDGDHSPYFRLVAYAFDRFFNLGEAEADEIDWSSANVYEKYDGSLIKLFWNGVQWVVSTSGSVGGAGNVGDSGKSFEELFWDTFRFMRYNAFDLNPDYCYVFELCAPENRIVVKYDEPMLRLLAVRDRANDFVELPLGDFSRVFWVAESFDYGAIQLLQAVNARGADHEGFIVCDAYGRRIKVKSDVYVQLHRVRGNGEPNFSELYLNDDLDEFLLHFPDYSEKFNALRENLALIAWGVEEFVRLYSDYSQKEFAVIVMENHPKVSGAMFSIRSGKFANFAEYVAQMKPKQLDALLGL